jgi:hypothetical protein
LIKANNPNTSRSEKHLIDLESYKEQEFKVQKEIIEEQREQIEAHKLQIDALKNTSKVLEDHSNTQMKDHEEKRNTLLKEHD